MKKLFLSLVAAMLSTVGYAQSTMVATLNHNGEVKAYFGASAFKSAMDNATNGDAITLSSGRFDAADITKAVSIRGAGATTSADLLNAHGQTYIYGTTHINITDSTTDKVLFMEGIYFNDSIEYSGVLNNSRIQKCRILGWYRNEGTMNGVSFLNCRICRYIGLNTGNVTFINSIICDPMNNSFEGYSIEFINCFVKFCTYDINRIINSSYTNCIIQSYYSNSDRQNYLIPSSCIAYNCLGITYPSSSTIQLSSTNNIFSYMPSNNTSNKYIAQSEISKVFKTYSYSPGLYITDTNSFELTDSAAVTYLGNDGTQIGVFGGNFPYTEEPDIPRITKLNVAAKSTGDGKLNVEVGLKAAE